MLIATANGLPYEKYPRRIFIERWNDNWQWHQRYQDVLYESECVRLGIVPDPRLSTAEDEHEIDAWYTRVNGKPPEGERIRGDSDRAF